MSWLVPDIRFEELKYFFIELFVKGHAIKAIFIDAEFRSVLAQGWGARGKKGKMSCTGNKMEFRSARQRVGESRNRIRKHPVPAELRSPKLNGRVHILDGVRCRKLVERVRYDVGFDPSRSQYWTRPARHSTYSQSDV